MNGDVHNETLVPEIDSPVRATGNQLGESMPAFAMRAGHGRWVRTKTTLDMVATVLMIAVSALLLSLLLRGLFKPSERPETSGAASESLPRLPVSLAGVVTKGSAAAPLAIVEYSDFQCPYCGKFTRETLPKIEREFIDTGRLLYAFRHLPLAIHPFARDAAKAANCAGQQGKFWPMHDLLFANQGQLGLDNVMAYSTQLGLDRDRFRSCREKDSGANVDADVRSAQELRISGTPTFLVGQLSESGVKVLARLRGSVPYEKMKQTLETVQESLTRETRR